MYQTHLVGGAAMVEGVGERFSAGETGLSMTPAVLWLKEPWVMCAVHCTQGTLCCLEEVTRHNYC